MNAAVAHRTRHLVVRLDQGDELPGALLRALDEHEARAGVITGVGSLSSVEIVVAAHGRPAHRRVESPCEIVSLSGNVARLDGAGSLHIGVTLSRETETGLELFGGQLVSARALGVELHVVVFDDLSLTRTADERTGLPTLVLQAAPPPRAAAAAPAPAPEPVHAAEPAQVEPAPAAPAPAPAAYVAPAPAVHVSPANQSVMRAPETAPRQAIITPPPAVEPPRPPQPTVTLEQAVLPAKIQRPKSDSIEIYPETGDLVNHFAFGECTVVSSDGDRIRLRQDKEGRVREVALAMLKIEAPTVAADGVRHFKLTRKN